MRNYLSQTARLAAGLFLAFTIQASAQTKPFLHPLFTHNMVLQRDVVDNVWGWTTPGALVTVIINNQTNVATAGADGRWQVQVGPFAAGGGACTLTVTGPQSVTITNVLMGDVWLFSGQSNMERQLGPRPPQPDILNYQAEAAAATNLTAIRHYLVPQLLAVQPRETNGAAQWTICSPTTVLNFTAVGFFMARNLYQTTNVPIGILHSSWGGTRIDPWIDPDSARGVADFSQTVFDLAGQTNTTTSTVTEIYNAMIAPLVDFKIKGVVWYQGESSADRPQQYNKLLPVMMGGWRNHFGQPNLPFIICQLPCYNAAQTLPVETGSYAEMREAQLNSVKGDAYARLAILLDTGRANSADTGSVNIHPPDKQQVGQRVAWAALDIAYGRSLVSQGPFFSGATVQGTNLICSFTNVGAGLTAGWFVQLNPVVPTNTSLTGFAIAGADKVFYSGSATIASGNTVKVFSASVPSPLYVRLGWGNNPACNLYGMVTNAGGAVVDGLPAAPFRNDPVYALNVNSGSGGNFNLAPGATANATASGAPASEAFAYWAGDTAQLSATNTMSVTATMSKPYISIRASYSIVAAPGGFTASATNQQITLNWSAISGAHYNMKRSLSVGGPFTLLAANVNALVYVDSAVSNNIVYYYKVAGTNLVNQGPDSSAQSAQPLGPAPTGLSATASNALVMLTWNVTVGATAGYNVKRSVVSGNSYATIATNVPSTAYNDTNVVNGTTYYYVVTAANPNGESPISSQVSAMAAVVQPPVLTATAFSNRVGLNWSASSGATGYLVKRSGVLGGSYSLLATNVTTSFTDNNVTNGFTYYYVVNAFNGIGQSPDSAEARAILLAPGTPTNLVALALDGRVVLSWAAAFNPTNYNVKRSTSGPGNVATIASVAGTGFTDSNVVNGTLYYYAVAAVNGLGESANSSPVSALPNATLQNRATNGTASASTANAPNESADKAFDGTTATKWYSAVGANVNPPPGWLQYDFGVGNEWAVVRYDISSANDVQQRDPMDWQLLGSNDGSSWTTLDTRSGQVFASRLLTRQFSTTNTPAYRYHRLNITANNGGSGFGIQLSELALMAYNKTPSLAAAPAGLTATAGDALAILNWNASSGAASYNLKRSTTSAGPYATIAGSLSALAYTNTGLANGTNYYFVVSANNGGGESLDSVPAGARPVSFVPVPMTANTSGDQLQINWPADHTGWRLQAQTNSLNSGLGTNWTTVASSSNVNQLNVPLNSTDGSVFFRLVYP